MLLSIVDNALNASITNYVNKIIFLKTSNIKKKKMSIYFLKTFFFFIIKISELVLIMHM